MKPVQLTAIVAIAGAAALAAVAGVASSAPPTKIARVGAGPSASRSPSVSTPPSADAEFAESAPRAVAPLREAVATVERVESTVESRIVARMRAKLDGTRFVDIDRFAPPATRLLGDSAGAVRACLGRRATAQQIALLEARSPELLVALVDLHARTDTCDRLVRHHAHERLDRGDYIFDDLSAPGARARKIAIADCDMWRLRTTDGALLLRIDPLATMTLVDAQSECEKAAAEIERLLEPLARPEHDALLEKRRLPQGHS